MAGVATRAAQGVSALAQLWLFAPQQQAFDVAAEVAGVQAACCPTHPANTTASTAVYLLRLAHGDRAQKDIAIHCRAADARAASQSEHIGLPRHQRTSAFVAAADALGTRTVKCAVPEPKKYALWRGTVAMTV